MDKGYPIEEMLVDREGNIWTKRFSEERWTQHTSPLRLVRTIEHIIEYYGPIRVFGEVCNRCGKNLIHKRSSEICEVCDNVALCVTCFVMHEHEVEADKQDGLA